MPSFVSSGWNALSASTLVMVGVVTAMIGVIWMIPREKLDPREPPLAKSRIPFIGHMINLLWYQNGYFRILHKTQPSPISTLLIFSQRIYIIFSPTLAQSAFRLSKAIDFETIKQNASCKAVGFSQHATDIIHSPFVPDPEIEGRMGNYMADLHTEMYGALALGRGLLETNRRVLEGLVGGLNELGFGGEKGDGGEEIGLFEWVRGSYTRASAKALYGEENPVAWDERFVQMVWDFEKDLGLLVLDKYPSLTARKGHLARTAITPAFESYYGRGLLSNASAFVQGRARCARKWGLTSEEMSQAEISILFAAVTNTVPIVFYMICWIFSSPSLLQELRDEIQGIVRVGKTSSEGGEDGEWMREMRKMNLNIENLKENCPLLTACFHESLRLVKTGFSIRTVLEDTLLAERWLLKKGAIVQIPTGVLQSDRGTWGGDADVFDPFRWLSDRSSSSGSGLDSGNSVDKDSYKSKEKRKAQNAAFIPFGGGKNLCPGRHLAFNEISAFVAVVVLGFEIEDLRGGRVEVPEMAVNRLGDGSTSPKADVKVRLRRREGWEDVKWGFVVREGE